MLSCGGLETVVNCMHRAVNRLKEGSESVQLAVCLTKTVFAVTADNGTTCSVSYQSESFRTA